MNVKLVSVTKPLVPGLETAEDLMVYAARVSNKKNQLNTNTGAKLIKYCIEHKHWSVFDQADMCVEVTTSRAMAAQILRHSSLKFQELSGRYAEYEEAFEPIELRLQGTTNRQVGDEEYYDPNLDEEIEEHIKSSFELYKKLKSYGIANECARFVLPQNLQTTLYCKGSCRSWIHYLQVRCAPDAQKEHREVANAIREIFIQQFPIVSRALGWIEEVEK